MWLTQISPGEIEDVIAEHPLVKEACVVAIPDPGGHIARAFVTLVENQPDVEAVIQQIKEHTHGMINILDLHK